MLTLTTIVSTSIALHGLCSAHCTNLLETQYGFTIPNGFIIRNTNFPAFTDAINQIAGDPAGANYRYPNYSFNSRGVYPRAASKTILTSKSAATK